MKSKFKLFMFIAMALVLPFLFFDKAYAFTLAEQDGEYALVLNANEGKIDGSDSKTIRFNFDEGEKLVKISDFASKVMITCEDKEFNGWASDAKGETKISELSIDKFSSTDSNGTKYATVYAVYKEISYNIRLDFNGGTIDGDESVNIKGSLSEFKTIDLSQYKPTREGCYFCGWGYDGKVITSIDKSYVLKNDRMTVFALYKSNTKSEVDDTVLILDANGGTIEGEKSKKYDYLATSGSAMPIFHYIPKRTGYNFRGWNAKKDGYGKNYDLLPKSYWRNDKEPELKKVSLKDDGKYYNYLTLYANWEKTSGGDGIDGPPKEIPTRNESELKGSVLFEEPRV